VIANWDDVQGERLEHLSYDDGEPEE